MMRLPVRILSVVLLLASQAVAFEDTRFTWTRVIDDTMLLPGGQAKIDYFNHLATDGENLAIVATSIRPSGFERRVLLYSKGKLVPAWNDVAAKPDKSGHVPSHDISDIAIDGETIYFSGKLATAKSTGIYMVKSGVLREIVGKATPRLGLKVAPGEQGWGFGAVAARKGKLAYSAHSVNLTKPDAGIFSYENGKNALLADSKMIAPGGNTRFRTFSNLNWSGDAVVFSASMGDATSQTIDQGVFKADSKGITCVARTGQKTPRGSTFRSFKEAVAGPTGCAFVSSLDDGTESIFIQYGQGPLTSVGKGSSMKPYDKQFKLVDPFLAMGPLGVFFKGMDDDMAAPRGGEYLWTPEGQHLWFDTTLGERRFPGLPRDQTAGADSTSIATGHDGPNFAAVVSIRNSAPAQKKEGVKAVYFLSPKQ